MRDLKLKYTRDLVNYYKSQLNNSMVVCNNKEYENSLCINSIEEIKELERLALIGEAMSESNVIIGRYDKYNQLKPKTLTIDEVVTEYQRKCTEINLVEPISFELYCVEIENIPYYNELIGEEYDDVYDRYREYVKCEYNVDVE